MTMRFDEVTERLGATVKYPGHPHDGLPMNVAIPSMGSVRIWQAVHGGYSWSIMFEPGVSTWSEEQRAKHVGYTASYRLTKHNRSSQTIRIDGRWDSFTKAEDACKTTWRQIRSAS